MENPWHNWHKPEEALKMEVAAIAQRQGQRHLQDTSVSTMVVEPHHSPDVAGGPIKEGAMVTNERDDIPEDITVTGVVVVISMVVET